MNRFRNVLLRKCKSLSRVGRPPSSYSDLRSMSAREDDVAGADEVSVAAAGDGAGTAVVLVGGSRRRYVISARHLSHPLIAALIDGDGGGDGRERRPVAVNCEVVLFDHLLWMLDNAVDLRAGAGADDDDAMRELAQLYAC